jgi:predicted dithiol-disulfide oxidoreductase (DUF899 family)
MNHAIVSRGEWLEARTRLLAKEKALTRLRDELAAERRALPWVRVEKEYVFDGPAGKQSLPELFAGRSQLVVYHFMFGPDAEVGCKSCSFWADSFNGIVGHLGARDVSFVAISRAPLAKLQAFARRMGWTFPWLSSGGSDFNYDYHVSFAAEQVVTGELTYNYAKVRTPLPDLPGVSVFFKDPRGDVFHTYSAYARGIDALNAAYQYLDLAPKGRDEAGLSFSMTWVRFHDEYPQP